MSNILLKASRDKYIKIIFQRSSRTMILSSRAKFVFHWKKENYELFDYDMAWFLEIMEDQLKSVLENNKKLKKFFYEKDIGYIENQIKSGEIPYIIEGKEWEGYDYCFFAGEKGGSHFTIWLYNNEKGEIVLHITQTYDEEMEKVGITYQEFMQNYKPVLTEVIPHQVISTWLDQCKALYKQLQENEKWWDEVEHPRLKAAGKCKECKAEENLTKNA